MKKSTPAGHWYSPFLRGEKKIVKAISEDVDHTLEDMQRLEEQLGAATQKHPFLYYGLGLLAIISVLVLMALAQVQHNDETFGPGFNRPLTEQPLVP